MIITHPKLKPQAVGILVSILIEAEPWSRETLKTLTEKNYRYLSAAQKKMAYLLNTFGFFQTSIVYKIIEYEPENNNTCILS